MAEGGQQPEKQSIPPPPYGEIYPEKGSNIYPGMPEDKSFENIKLSDKDDKLPEKKEFEMDFNDIAIVMKAIDLAARRHRSQRRKDPSQTPYINHPIGVAYILTNEAKINDKSTIVAAILHDIVEDTKTTFDEIKQIFGDEVENIVRECTLDKSASRDERRKIKLERASTLTKKAKLIELADKLYNLRDIERVNPIGWTHHSKKDYFKYSRDYIAKIKGTNEIIEAALDHIINKNI